MIPRAGRCCDGGGGRGLGLGGGCVERLCGCSFVGPEAVRWGGKNSLLPHLPRPPFL